MLYPRARAILLPSTPILIAGIASSLVLTVVMKVASVLQRLLWEHLPVSIGIAQDSPVWIIDVPTLTGIMVGLIIRYSHSHAGPDPAYGPLTGTPVPTSAVPGLLAALILGLAGGINLGSEHPIMIVDIALAVAPGSHVFPRIVKLNWTILAPAGTIDTLLSTSAAAALVSSQTLGNSDNVSLQDHLFTSLMAIAVGSSTASLFFHPHFLLPVIRYIRVHLTDILSGAVVAAIAAVARIVAIWCPPHLYHLVHRLKHPVLTLGADGSAPGILGIIGGPLTLFKGLDETQQMASSQTLGTSNYFMLAVIKLAVLVVAAASGFRGRRIFPAVLVGVALGLMPHAHVEAVPAAIAVSRLILGLALVITRDAQLSLLMATVVVPDSTLLPLLCIVMLPAWLLLAGKSAMITEHPDKQLSVVARFQRTGHRA